MYGYALEGLCQHLGMRLDSDSVGDVCDLEPGSSLEDARPLCQRSMTFR